MVRHKGMLGAVVGWEIREENNSNNPRKGRGGGEGANKRNPTLKGGK